MRWAGATASTVEKRRDDWQGGAPWLEEVEREILASGIGSPPKTDSSTAVVRGANRKKVNTTSTKLMGERAFPI